MIEALWLWRQFPRQIASDLARFYHRRIAEWHHGTMRSGEFLELCEFMPLSSAFKSALARHNPMHEWLDWSDTDQAMFQTANELSVLRSGQVQGVTSEDLGSQIFLSPAKQRQLVQEAEEHQEAMESVFAMTAGDDDDEEEWEESSPRFT